MIIIRKEWSEKDKKLHDVHEPTQVTTGDQIQWNEQSKHVSITRNSEPLYWEGMQFKRLINWIHTEGQFENYVMNSAWMLNLTARKVEGERHVTFKFE